MSREKSAARALETPEAAAPRDADSVAQTGIITWDGLGLAVPPEWEPARLGLGYLMFEDASGPRLSLRWQRLKKPLSPEKVLKRLARRRLFKPASKPQGAVAAMLAALPPEYEALACADASGRSADAVLFIAPGRGLAVLAAPHASPDEKAAPWAEAMRTLRSASPGAFGLFDVSGEAPGGFRLSAFSVQLGHFHFQYRLGNETLDYFRFAPSEVILRAKTLEGWAGDVLAQTLGKARVFTPGYFQGCPAARYEDSGHAGLATTARSLAARMFSRARFARAMAWRPDGSKILAAVARHRGELSEETFEEVCRRYVVQTPRASTRS